MSLGNIKIDNKNLFKRTKIELKQNAEEFLEELKN